MRISKCAVSAVAAVAVTGTLVGATTVSARTEVPAAAATRAAANPLKPLLKRLAGKTLKQRETILYNQAKAEGGLTWYTSLSRTIGPGVVKAFEAKYPGVKVDMFRGSSEDVTARLYSESTAGKSGADV